MSTKRNNLHLMSHRRATAAALIAGAVGIVGAAASAGATTTPPDSTAGDTRVSAAPSAGGMVPVTVDGDTVTVDVGDDRTVEINPNDVDRVAVLMFGFGNQYLDQNRAGAEDAAEAYGLDVEVFDPAFDPAVQRNQLELAINSGDYDLIAIQQLDDSLCDLALSAADHGVLLNSFNSPLCGRAAAQDADLWAPGSLNYVGGPNGFDGDLLQAESVIADNPDGAVALVIAPLEGQGPGDAFVKAFVDTAEGTDFDIVSVAHVGQTRDVGYEATQAAIQANPDLSVVVTQYSETTIGAVQAIEEAGLTGQINVYDMGGASEIIDLIRSGDVRWTVPYFPYSSAYAAVESLALAAQGVSVPRVILNDGAPLLDADGDARGVIISGDNVDDFVPEY